MADETGFPGTASRPEAMMATAQHGLACWFRAWTQIASGLMSAGMAYMELARSMGATAPVDWEHAAQAKSPAEAAQKGLGAAKAKFDAAIGGYRRINDELTACFFDAAESLARELGSDTGKGTAERSFPPASPATRE